MKQIVLIGLIAAAATFGNDERDSLRMELERINDELERTKENHERDSSTETNGKSHDEKGNLTTIEEAKKLFVRIDTKLSKDGRHDFGGSGGMYGGALYLDMKPVKDLINRELLFSGTKSPLYGTGLQNGFGSREVIALTGGLGFGGIGNGVRIGGGGLGGEKEFSVHQGDMIHTMKIEFGYGGVILAKHVGFGKNNVTVSGMVGAGSLLVDINSHPSSGSSGLLQGSSSKWDGNSLSSGESSFFMTDLSVTYTYSLLKWLHVGVDGAGLFQHSAKGFNGSDGYTSFSPMARMRILFGRLG